MSSWDQYTNDKAEVGGQGEWPAVPDDLYDAIVKDVSEPEEQADIFNPGKTRTQFYLTWELAGGDVPEGTTLRQYLSLPESYLSDGYVNEKSNLYKTMEALGYDMGGKFKVDPPSWQGERARVMVENKVGANGGDPRPRITAVKPARNVRQPAAARR